MGYAERAPHMESMVGADELMPMHMRDIAVAGLVGVDRQKLHDMMEAATVDLTAEEVPERALDYLMGLIAEQLPLAEREARHIITVERVETMGALASQNAQLQERLSEKEAELRTAHATLQRAEMIEQALAEVRTVLAEQAPSTIPIIDKALAPQLELVKDTEDDHDSDQIQKSWTLEHILQATFGERAGSRLARQLARLRLTRSS